MYGIICTEDIKNVGHSAFLNYKLALENYFGKDQFKNVKSILDLENISHLFIVDEHFHLHSSIWCNNSFINEINKKNIRTIIFNTEKIYMACFPWNIDIQNKVNSIKNHFQFISDSVEAEKFNKQVINKFMLSKSTDLGVKRNDNKSNKIIFAGQMQGPQYERRRNLIQKIYNLKLDIALDVYDTKRKLSYVEFLELTNNYKYVLCPLGTGDFFSLRHFEAIHLGCIPIQEVTQPMYKWYGDEYKNCITFINPETIKSQIINFIPHNKEIFLEDMFEKINLRNYM